VDEFAPSRRNEGMQRSVDVQQERNQMNKQITFRAVLAVALLTGCVAIEAKPPTCAQPLGKWNDDTKSVIEIRTYDTATGAITGEFISHTDVGSYPMVGWINSAPAESSAPGKASKGDHADVFTLAVRWVNPGAITTWTGTCAVNSQSGLAQISTLWHTARPDTGHEWDHLVTGSEVLVPVE
jgi:avidin family protein